MQSYQTPVKRCRQQPNRQRQDKKKAEEMAMKLRNRMEMMRLVIVWNRSRSIQFNGASLSCR